MAKSGNVSAPKKRRKKAVSQRGNEYLTAAITASSSAAAAEEEGCSGDPARRLGNEYLYQMQAEQNIEIMKSKSVQVPIYPGYSM